MLVKGSGSAVGVPWEQGREENNQEKKAIKQLRHMPSEPELRSGYRIIEALNVRTCSLPELSAFKTTAFEAGGVYFYSAETFLSGVTRDSSMKSPAERVEGLDSADSLPENSATGLAHLTMAEGVPPRTEPMKQEGWGKLPLSIDASKGEPSPIEEQRFKELLKYRDRENNRRIFWGKLEHYSVEEKYGIVAVRFDKKGYEFLAGFYYDDVDNTVIHEQLGARRASDQLNVGEIGRFTLAYNSLDPSVRRLQAFNISFHYVPPLLL